MTTRTALAIGDVAARTGLSVHTLRYYEGIGLLDRVERDAGGRRVFTDADLDWINLLTKLRSTGMPVTEMVRYAELVRLGPTTFAERLALLERHRERMSERLADLTEARARCLDVVDRKINLYRGDAAS